MSRNDHPEGTARILAAPVRLPNGVEATAELYYQGRWVAAAPHFGDLAPILSYDGPRPEQPADDPAPAWFYQLGQGE